MTQGYIKSGELQPDTHRNPRVLYAVKIFEALDLATLQNMVNLYLFELPVSEPQWQPSLVSVQYGNYLTSGPTTTHHVCTLTLYASGTLATQFVPPA
jgi:hypothetical protein